MAAINHFFQHAAALGVFSYEEYGIGLDEEEESRVGQILLAISQSPHKSLKELRLLSGTTYLENYVTEFASKMQNSKLSRIWLCNKYLEQWILEQFLEIPGLRSLRLQGVHISDRVDVSLALEGRCEPMCVILKTETKIKQTMNGTYIKAKGGHVQFYPNPQFTT